MDARGGEGKRGFLLREVRGDGEGEEEGKGKGKGKGK